MRKYYALLLSILVSAIVITSAHAQEDAAKPPESVERSIEKLDDALDALIDTGAEIEQLSSGHKWTEGPVWNSRQKMLLFCDIPNNEINRWDAASGKVSVYMKPSGYEGPDSGRSKEPGLRSRWATDRLRSRQPTAVPALRRRHQSDADWSV